ncbi:DUF1639 family protein [Sesbania bispinosa]|nr:DUF1639 family protein [Sesbania bispinosa]
MTKLVMKQETKSEAQLKPVIPKAAFDIGAGASRNNNDGGESQEAGQNTHLNRLDLGILQRRIVWRRRRGNSELQEILKWKRTILQNQSKEMNDPHPLVNMQMRRIKIDAICCFFTCSFAPFLRETYDLHCPLTFWS